MEDKSKLNNNKENVKLEGKLEGNISQPYVSRQGNTFYVATLIDEEEEKRPLFFWDDGRFDEQTIAKIQNLVDGDHIVVSAQKRVNPRDERIIFHVTEFIESGFEVFN